MKTRIQGAKIACLDINLQKQRMHLGVQILVEDPNELEAIRRRLVRFLRTVLMLTLDLGSRRSRLRESERSWPPERMSY